MRISSLLVFLTFALSAIANAQPISIQNSGMEGEGSEVSSIDNTGQTARSITGQVATGWADDSSWADLDLVYSLDKQNPHSGQTAQRIELKRTVGYGAVQFVQKVALRKGRVYRFTIWLKGSPGQSVSLSLRQVGAPYKAYSTATASLNAEWRPFQVWGLIPEDVEGYLMIRTGTPQTFWVDDASFEDLTDAKSDKAPQTGNILPGGNFESGLSYGWAGATLLNYTAQAGDPNTPIRKLKPYSDAATAAVGKKSLRLDLPANSQSHFSTPAVQTNFGRPHSFSLWLKASERDTAARISLVGGDMSQDITVGTEWKRFIWNFTPPLLTNTRLTLSIWGADKARTIWLDGALLEERADASPKYVPDAPYELTLQMPRFGNYVFDGEVAKANFLVAPNPPSDARVRLGYQSYEKTGGAFTTWRTVKATVKEIELPAFGGSRGIWKLRAQLVDAKGKALSSPYDLVWCRLPKPRKLAPEKSVFGIHVPMQRDFLALAQATGSKWNRLHDLSNIAKWGYAEWEKGVWRFDDETVNLAPAYGIRILGMLDGAPDRVTTKSRGGRWTYNGLWNIPDAPGALDEWRTYVKTVTNHYKGRIDDWEVWNEPWGTWFLETGNPNATPQLYGQLLNIAYEEAKKQNPKANILGIDTFPGRDDSWTIPALKASGNNPYDVFSFHDYSDVLYGTNQMRATNMVNRFDELQGQFGPVKQQWMTEGGAPSVGSMYAPETGGLPAVAQPAYSVRYDVSHLAAGTKRLFFYSVRAATSMGETGYQGTEHDGALKPVLAARAVLASLVDGAGKPVRREAETGIDCYQFPAYDGKKVSVLWSYDNRTHSLAVPKGTRALDIWGNPLKGARVNVDFLPIYFVQ